MDSPFEWHHRAVCKCGWHSYVPFANLFHLSKECCPQCAAPKTSLKICVMKYERVVPLTWHPSTWLAGYKWAYANGKEPCSNEC